MAWPVKVSVNTLIPLLFTVVLCTAQPTSQDVDITRLNEYVKNMDAVLHEVQSHSQAQEQKYSAVLSSVLSQLTQTIDELEELRTSKNVTEELQEEVENLNKELKNLKETNNKTLLDYASAMEELTELKQSRNKTLLEYATAMKELEMVKQTHNQSLIALEMVNSEVKSLQQECSASFSKSNSTGLSQLNSAQTQVLVSFAEIVGEMSDPKWPWLSKDIGFEANLASWKSVSKSGTVVFDMVIHNEVNCYNKATGYFTAPESGTYLFWANIAYRSDNSSHVFSIITDKTIFGRAYGYGGEPYGTASATASFYLKKGERAWIRSDEDVHLKGFYTSAGAVLIKQY